MPKLKPGHISPTPTEDAQINAGILTDPDTLELSSSDFTRLKRVGRPRSDSPKVQVTVRYDADIIHAFQAGGPGWQTRMNNALREWLHGRQEA